MATSNENVAKNLEVIRNAIVQHNGNCPGEIVAILMHPIEVERLDFEEFMGIPIEADEEIQTGAFKLICDLENPELPSGELEDAISDPEKVSVS